MTQVWPFIGMTLNISSLIILSFEQNLTNRFNCEVELMSSDVSNAEQKIRSSINSFSTTRWDS